ncbi:cupin domain-containing protein [Roseibium sp. RKSG952]|nr:cupin domain-containing protein [Roseibium sp. RKSG952]
MEIFKAGSRPSERMPSTYFTGGVWRDPIINSSEPAQTQVFQVRFEAGARTYWHTHPVEQTLHVMSGLCRFQAAGEPVVELRTGDTIVIPPQVKHWHGASPDADMVHLVVLAASPGADVDWMEPVSDGEYARDP